MALDFSDLGNEAIGKAGRSNRKGIGMIEAVRIFGDPENAAKWMEWARWGDDPITCPKCGSERTTRSNRADMPFRCKDCRKWFSVKTGTPMGDSKLPFHYWLLAAYQDLTNLKGVSSLKLSRDLGIKQSSAWYMLQRLHEAFMDDAPPSEFKQGGEFQVDEAYIGGLEGNKHARDKIPGGQGGATKMIVICITHVASGKVWADVITDTKGQTVADVVHGIVPQGSTLYTDEGRHYGGIKRERHAVNHNIGEYARMVDLAAGIKGLATTNNAESAWSMLKR
ncbi:MAG: IS1595 family transposase, partial [Boseongicola sp. SB0676_bin_33]|nr:IS1595 family transposase [Boseongicola sp. SB0676_bin_33]